MPQTFEVDPYVSNKNEKVTFYHVVKCSNGEKYTGNFSSSQGSGSKYQGSVATEAKRIKFLSVLSSRRNSEY